jgi:hypothetical protein
MGKFMGMLGGHSGRKVAAGWQLIYGGIGLYLLNLFIVLRHTSVDLKSMGMLFSMDMLTLFVGAGVTLIGGGSIVDKRMEIKKIEVEGANPKKPA